MYMQGLNKLFRQLSKITFKFFSEILTHKWKDNCEKHRRSFRSHA